ncbi:hypothetical protein, partial [Skermanella aerolata]|uniref:hypothetical protein n=1 Tax=Skermanella aerolata TaxID=393310 RepID=UPI001649C720
IGALKLITSDEGRAVISSVATYFGIPKEIISASVAFLKAVSPNKGDNQTRRYEYKIPEGYRYCTTIHYPKRDTQTHKASFSLFLDQTRPILHWNSWSKSHGGPRTQKEFVRWDFDVIFASETAYQEGLVTGKCQQPLKNARGQAVIFAMYKDKNLAYNSTIKG